MAGYIKGVDRFQTQLFPPSIEELVGENNEVRVIDAFVDSLDFSSLGFKNAKPNSMGAPSYDPRDLLKIYIYCYPKKVRSSRNIWAEVKRNIELIWLVRGITPDFRTISDFRKNNIKSIKKVLKEFNKLCLELDVFSRELTSLDGSKFKAVNSKDNNFTKDKLVDRIKRLNEKVDEYLEMLANSEDDASFSTEDRIDISNKLNKAKQKALEYNKHLKTLTDSGENQISLTDKDSRLMKCNNNMLVGYNAQANSDTKSHMVTNVSVSNKPNDIGSMTECGNATKKTYGVNQLEQLVDGGYVDEVDIKNCFEQRIVPILPEGEYKFSYDYVENEITDEIKKGNTTEDIIKCFSSGVIPDNYSYLNIKAIITTENITINEFATTNETDINILKQKANKGFFVRDKLNNCVYCPYGNTLNFKRSTKQTDIFIGNSECLNCKNKCTKNHVREVEMPFNVDITACATFKKRVPRHMVTITKKKVVIKYIPDKEKYKLRKNTSEHPFGTLKRAHDASYFLLKGVDKVEAELTLSVLGYNFKRLINIIPINKLIEHLKNRNNTPISSTFSKIFDIFIFKIKKVQNRTYFFV